MPLRAHNFSYICNGLARSLSSMLNCFDMHNHRSDTIQLYEFKSTRDLLCAYFHVAYQHIVAIAISFHRCKWRHEMKKKDKISDIWIHYGVLVIVQKIVQRFTFHMPKSMLSVDFPVISSRNKANERNAQFCSLLLWVDDLLAETSRFGKLEQNNETISTALS